MAGSTNGEVCFTAKFLGPKTGAGCAGEPHHFAGHPLLEFLRNNVRLRHQTRLPQGIAYFADQKNWEKKEHSFNILIRVKKFIHTGV
jgi:hypothetical protein